MREIDWEVMMKELSFNDLIHNSMSAVEDWDFILETIIDVMSSVEVRILLFTGSA